jgi:hypothetical protein
MLGGTWVQVFTRAEFLTTRWQYGDGEHVAVFGPTQISGKTRLLFDLLAHTDTTEMIYPPVVLVAKPADKTVQADLVRLGYERTKVWPPRHGWVRRDLPAGYAFWPEHDPAMSSKANTARVGERFRAAIDHQFWLGRRGPTITVADELYGLVATYGLMPEITRHLTQGMGMGAGLWFATQRPSGTQAAALSGFVFNSATHTFVARDPVRSNRKKYADIGGVESEILEEATTALPPFAFFYVHRNGPRMCVVLAK